MSRRVGVDVGGTFTDLVTIDDTTGSLTLLKVPSDPEHPDRAVVEAIRESGIETASITRLVHGTTVSTNAILERRGACVGLLTTTGFEDVLEIGHIDRPHLYDLSWSKPPALVPRRLRVGIPERMDHRGEELEPLDEAAVIAAVEHLIGAGVEAIAVCFLHAYANPAHEVHARDIIASRWPDMRVSISSTVMNAIREFERTSTVVVDAYVKPIMAEYLQTLERSLVAEGMRCGVTVMQSSGGVMTSLDCAELPVHTLLSGPAGGVIAALNLAAETGYQNVITIDIGGTSADAAIITGGKPVLTTETEIDWGIPVQVPMIDIRTIGAGGGSMAWIDRGGRLKVGPQSCGARPGPACYGLGGERASVTDANLVLGYLPQDDPTIGALPLRPSLAAAAIEHDVGEPLGLDLLAAARGIVSIVNANMRNLIRVISVQQGHDPRDYALMAFGGGGPVHAVALARELGIRTVLIPLTPGVLSAHGLLMAVPRHDFVQSLPRLLHEMAWSELTSVVERLEERGRHLLRRAGIGTPPRVEVSLDMQYERQNYTLNVPLSDDVDSVDHLRVVFTDAYQRKYGYRMEAQPVEIVNCRVSVFADDQPLPGRLALTDVRPEAAGNGVRDVFFEEWAEVRPCPVLERGQLEPGRKLPSPCIVQQPDTSVVIPPGATAAVDPSGMIVITLADERQQGNGAD
jgi:N-methylhydantoinase A